jgi:2-hydroxy-6-oxonona-2,4-dienedioate hydrolase
MTYVIDDDSSFGRYRSFWTDLFGRSFTIGYVDAGGIRTRYIEAGDPGNPTVVMLHGIGGSLELFTPNIGPLSEHFHVLALDMVGFGLTDKVDHDLEISHYVEHLEAFLAAKEITKVMVFAVSLGAWVSVAFARRHPADVERMVLIAPAGTIAPPEKAARFSQVQAQETVDNPSWERLNLTLDHLVFDASSKLPDALAVRRAISLEPGMPDSTRRIMSLLDPDAIQRNMIPESAWRGLAAPVLLVECPDTVDLSFHLIQQVRELIPHCEVLSVPRTAHWPHFEDPETVNPVAIRFLKDVPAGES